MSIRSRIFGVFVLALVLGSYAFFNWLRDDMRPRYMEAQEDILVDLAHFLASQIEVSGLQQNASGWRIDSGVLQSSFDRLQAQRFEAQIYSLLKTAVDIRVYVTDQAGLVLFDSRPGAQLGRDMSQWRDVALTLQGQYGARSTQDDMFAEGSTMYVGAPIRADDDIIGVVSVGKTTRNAERFLESAIPRFITAALGTLGLALLLAFALNWWVTRPLYQLQNYARQLQSGGAVTPPRLRDRDMAGVAQAMTDLRRALDGKQYVEDYVQALTHELKSPAAAISGAAELLMEDPPPDQQVRFLRNIDKEARRLNQLVERMLALAEIENRSGLERTESVDLLGLLSEAADSLSSLRRQKDLQLEFKGEKSLSVMGEAFLLQRALVNLLHNAMDFSPSGGRILLELRHDAQAGLAVLELQDQGPGVPDYAATRIYERFYSLPRADGHKGSGLGLSFVREIAQLHGGGVELSNVVGGGARARFFLPISRKVQV